MKTRTVYVVGTVLIASWLVAFSLGAHLRAGPTSSGTQLEDGSLTETADYLVWSNSGNYYAKNGQSGAIEFEDSTWASVYSDCLNAIDGNGTIIDRTDNMGPGPTTNRYRNGTLYDDGLKIDPLVLPPSQILSCFDGGANVEWTGYSSPSDKITNDTSFVVSGNRSIRLTDSDADGSGEWMRKSLDSSFDLREKSIFIRFRTNRCTYDGNVGDMVIQLHTDASQGNLYHTYVSIPQMYDYTYEVTVHLSELSVTGNPNPSDINTVTLQIHATVGYPLAVTFDLLALYEPILERPIFMFTVDDDTQDGILDKMKPVMDRYGFRGTFFWTSGSEDGMLSQDDARSLKESGWDIGSHGHEHLHTPGVADYPTDVTAQNTNEYVTDIIINLRWMGHEGLLSEKRFLGTPFADWQYETITVLEDYFHLTFASYLGTMKFPDGREHCWQRGEFDSKTLAQAQTAVGNAINQTKVLTSVFHTIDAGAFSLADFETFCEWLSEQDIEVMTPSDLLARYYPPNQKTYLNVVEQFTTLQPADDDYCHAAEPGQGTTFEVTTGITDPDVPRTLSITTTNIASPAGWIYIHGFDAKGKAITEIITVLAGGTRNGTIPFSSITSFWIHSQVTSSDSVSLGISDKLGLANPIEDANDVWKMKLNDTSVSIGTVDVYNGTVDCAVIGATDNITIWYVAVVSFSRK